VRDTSATTLIFFSCCALLLACLGVSTIWVKNRCCNILLSFCLLPTWSMIFIFSMILMSFSNMDAIVDGLCDASVQARDGANDSQNDVNEAEMTEDQKDVLKRFEWLTKDNVDSYMCSTYCPCDETALSSTWTDMSEDDVQKQGRLTTMDWYFGGKQYAIGSSTAYSSATTPVINKTFATFADCANDVVLNEADWDTVDEKIVDELFYYSNTKGENPFMGVLAFIEERYTCSGICSPQMFYATRSVDFGKPTQGCGRPVGKEFGTELGSIGTAGAIAGIMLFCTFLSSYCLWKKYDD